MRRGRQGTVCDGEPAAADPIAPWNGRHAAVYNGRGRVARPPLVLWGPSASLDGPCRFLVRSIPAEAERVRRLRRARM